MSTTFVLGGGGLKKLDLWRAESAPLVPKKAGSIESLMSTTFVLGGVVA